MTATHQTPPSAIALNLRAIDWILSRLVRLREQFPTRAGELAPRIDSALDERLRLMRLRDLAVRPASHPFPEHAHN
jgi:hypothetical protein